MCVSFISAHKTHVNWLVCIHVSVNMHMSITKRVTGKHFTLYKALQGNVSPSAFPQGNLHFAFWRMTTSPKWIVAFIQRCSILSRRRLPVPTSKDYVSSKITMDIVVQCFCRQHKQKAVELASVHCMQETDVALNDWDWFPRVNEMVNEWVRGKRGGRDHQW